MIKYAISLFLIGMIGIIAVCMDYYELTIISGIVFILFAAALMSVDVRQEVKQQNK